MMKKSKLSVKTSIMLRVKQRISIVFIILLASLSSACQMTEPPTDTDETNHYSVNYGQYYLWLKDLNSEQILLEEQFLLEEQNRDALKTEQLNGKTLSQAKLILIYSLPNPVIHQAYKAKRLLNEHLSANNNMNEDNLAFIMLLRDQLNTQLHLLEKQALANQEFNKLSDKHHLTINELNQQLKQVSLQLNHVNQQLMLLKQIDQNINERG